jgi:hypothetical protein
MIYLSFHHVISSLRGGAASTENRSPSVQTLLTNPTILHELFLSETSVNSTRKAVPGVS